ncbi:MAG: hypothetical protein AAGF12_02070 [Myxococcota bacterium]
MRTALRLARLCPALLLTALLVAAVLLAALLVPAAPVAAQTFDTTGVGATVPADDFPMYRRVGAELSYDEGTEVYSFDGYGHRPDDGWDMVGFAYREMPPGDFDYSIRLLDLPDCSYLNFGLMVREGLVGNERMVFLVYNRNADNWRFYTRDEPGNHEGRNCPNGYRSCQSRVNLDRFSDPANVFLRLERKDGLYTASYSTDGTSFVSLGDGEGFTLATEQVFAGVAMSCGNKGAARGVAHFDRVTFGDSSLPPPPPPTDGDPPDPPDATVPDAAVDAMVPDASVTAPDAGTPPEAPTPDASGCTAGPGAPVSGGFLPVFVAVLVLLRRRI